MKLQPGFVYELTYKLQSGNNHWYMYRATMTYLGASKFPLYEGQEPGTRELVFNLRPLAGTQTLRVDQILEARALGPTQGRDDNRHRMKASMGRMAKAE